MANPRNIVRFDGIKRVNVTYKIDNSTIVYDATQPHGCAQAGPDDGKAVTFSADDTVALCADGEAVIGKLILVEADGKASVQVGGYCTLPKAASGAWTRGKKIVGALGAAAAKGHIREVNTATAAELGVCDHVIQNNADSVDVWIKL